MLIEIKTARKGKIKDTFQFNGINPKYNHNFIVFVGILEDNLLYRILSKSKIKYEHKNKKGRKKYVYIVNLGTIEKQLVEMNPGNQTNYKLTLNKKELEDINNIENDLKLNNILKTAI